MPKILTITSVFLLFVNGVSAIVGGCSLMSDPTGKSIQLSMDLLEHAPFNDFFIPGLVLFLINGVFNLYAAVMVYYKKSYHPLCIFIAGIVLFLWIVFQLAWIQAFHPLQAIMGSISLLLMLFGYLLHQRHKSYV